MKKYEAKLHSFLISFLTACIVWLIIDNLIFRLSFVHFIIIEILAGFGEIFSTFMKSLVGIKTDTELDKLNE